MIIDYRTTHWGHNHFLKRDGEHFSGLIIHRTAPHAGDHIKFNTNYGHAVVEVITCEGLRDPYDMYKVRAVLVERVADPSIVTQEELDACFKEN